MLREPLKAPYPWFGGKSKVVPIVWSRFGDVPNYVEPFFGSGAMLLGRPHYPFDESVIRRETINDYDGHVANFWRAVQADPVAVAEFASWPVNEIDLKARGDWLYCRPQSREFVERMRAEPDHFCAKTAGWWVWFCCNWIGGLPSVDGNAHMNDDGVCNKRPHLSNAGQGVARQLPRLGDAGQGECEMALASLVEWMQRLADRLRRVRVCCGDWARVTGKSVTWNNAAPCGVFLDPPYADTAKRDANLYSTDSLSVAHDVREWAIEEGERQDMRIALCGYEGEHEMPDSWECVAWKSPGGYALTGDGNGKENAHRERIWFSPHCLKVERQRGLFDEAK